MDLKSLFKWRNTTNYLPVKPGAFVADGGSGLELVRPDLSSKLSDSLRVESGLNLRSWSTSTAFSGFTPDFIGVRILHRLWLKPSSSVWDMLLLVSGITLL